MAEGFVTEGIVELQRQYAVVRPLYIIHTRRVLKTWTQILGTRWRPINCNIPTLFVAGNTLRVPPIKQVKTCLFDQIFISSAHISLAVSDAVTRAFTLLNACASRIIGPFVAGADQICWYIL